MPAGTDQGAGGIISDSGPQQPCAGRDNIPVPNAVQAADLHYCTEQCMPKAQASIFFIFQWLS